MSSRNSNLFFFLLSFLIVAFGQAAWVPLLAPFAALCGYALFWKSIFQKNFRSRFWLSVLWFASVQGVQLSWMTTQDYMGPFILLVYAGLIFLLGLQFGFLSVLVTREPLTLLRCAALSGLWVIFEWLRLFPFSGFTWNLAGLSLGANTLSLQTASLFGVFGLSFWVLFVNLAGFRASFRRTKPSFVLFFGLALLPYFYGALYQKIPPQDDRFVTATLIQTSLLPEERSFFFGRLEKMIPPLQQWEAIMSLAQDIDTDLIVLPEGTFPFTAKQTIYPLSGLESLWKKYNWDLQELPPLGGDSSRFASNNQWFVSNLYFTEALANHTGSEVIIGLDDQDSPGKTFNAAFLCSPYHKPVRTEKRVLIPIAEYIPLKNWKFLSQFILDQYGIESSFEPGQEVKLSSQKIPLGISICYEETFSELTRHLRAKGAEVLVTISNDVWFPNSRLGKQHFYHGMIRAVENGTPLLRSSNSGVTAAVDCFGTILAMAPENEFHALTVDVPLQTIRTPYSFWGDSAILVLSALFALTLFRRVFTYKT